MLEGWKWGSIQVLGDPEHYLASATGHQRQGKSSEREGAGHVTAAPPEQGGKGSGEQSDLLQRGEVCSAGASPEAVQSFGPSCCLDLCCSVTPLLTGALNQAPPAVEGDLLPRYAQQTNSVAAVCQAGAMEPSPPPPAPVWEPPAAKVMRHGPRGSSLLQAPGRHGSALLPVVGQETEGEETVE